MASFSAGCKPGTYAVNQIPIRTTDPVFPSRYLLLELSEIRTRMVPGRDLPEDREDGKAVVHGNDHSTVRLGQRTNGMWR